VAATEFVNFVALGLGEGAGFADQIGDEVLFPFAEGHAWPFDDFGTIDVAARRGLRGDVKAVEEFATAIVQEIVHGALIDA
jgi:hypothetical protein